MLFREPDATDPPVTLAVSQPAHAWMSGQLLRAWAETLDETLLLAAEQHDIAWLDWETSPSFDPQTGRPHLFRNVGAAQHAPMWAGGVERALAAWGRRVALLVSRHGSLVYGRYAERHRGTAADAAAAAHYRQTQAVLQAGWASSLGLDAAALSHDTEMVALSDTLSLALCGELATPLQVDAPGRAGGRRSLRLAARPGDPAGFTLSPWPFRGEALVAEAEARPMPAAGRFADEAAMRAWLAAPERVTLQARLTPG